MLKQFGHSLYFADGPTVSFLGFPYPTRMAVARLSDGDVWVWSPIALTEELANAVQSVGSVRYIVSPNKIHHLFLHEWASYWPDAHLYAPPGLVRKKPEINFHAALDDEPPAPWATEIDQVVFRGSFCMEEVVFFHRCSRTAIVGDLIQRHSTSNLSGWKGQIMRLDGLVGEQGSTPREWQASFLQRNLARAARRKLLEWRAEQLLIAHGMCVHSGATEVIARALSWI